MKKQKRGESFCEDQNPPIKPVSVLVLHCVQAEQSQCHHSLLKAPPGLARHSDQNPKSPPGTGLPYTPSMALPLSTVTLLVLKQAVSSSRLLFPKVFK